MLFLSKQQQFIVASSSKAFMQRFKKVRMHAELLYNCKKCFKCKEELFWSQNVLETSFNNISSFCPKYFQCKLNTVFLSYSKGGRSASFSPSAAIFWQNDRAGIPENLLT